MPAVGGGLKMTNSPGFIILTTCPAFLSVLCLWSRFQVKFFYLTQLAYWLHALPELYFQKVRKVSKEALGTRGAVCACEDLCVFCMDVCALDGK